MAIPMKSVSFDPKIDTWGFNVERSIQRKNETVRWAGASRNSNISSMGVAGELQNLSGLNQGFCLDFIPYATMKGIHQSANGGSNDFDLKSGFDLFYKITPAITAALTLNTDFAEAEIDDRRVNLSRFPLFFAEKRDFFLQDATIFRFGGIQQNPLPFHSRKIGLGPDGRPIDIIGGLKVTGRTGAVNFRPPQCASGENGYAGIKKPVDRPGLAQYSRRILGRHDFYQWRPATPTAAIFWVDWISTTKIPIFEGLARHCRATSICKNLLPMVNMAMIPRWE